VEAKAKWYVQRETSSLGCILGRTTVLYLLILQLCFFFFCSSSSSSVLFIIMSDVSSSPYYSNTVSRMNEGQVGKSDKNGQAEGQGDCELANKQRGTNKAEAKEAPVNECL
jgi:hypothetical protein